MSGFWTFLSIVAAVSGWFATHLLQEARERRKETRGALDKHQDFLWKISRDARDFHCSTEFSEAHCYEINQGLQRFFRGIRRMRIVPERTYSELTISLRKSITLNNFDKSNFSQQSLQSPILAEIDGAAGDLDDALEQCYVEFYPPNFPFFRLSKFKFFWEAMRSVKDFFAYNFKKLF